jgi:hypothetical protein
VPRQDQVELLHELYGICITLYYVYKIRKCRDSGLYLALQITSKGFYTYSFCQNKRNKEQKISF